MTGPTHVHGCCRSLESPDTAAEDEARKALDKLRPLKDSWEELSGALTVSTLSIVLEPCRVLQSAWHIIHLCSEWLK